MMKVEELYEAIDKLYCEKKIEQVEPFLRKVLESSELESSEGEDRYRLAIAACNELGGFLRMTSRYEEGAVLYEKALKYLKLIGAEGTQDFATTQINYATMLNMGGKHDEALEIYKKAADILHKCHLDNEYIMATWYNNMSSVYQCKDEKNMAISLLEKALDVLENINENDTEVAVTCSNLANLYIEVHDFDKAERFAERAVTVLKDISGDRDVHYSAAVCALGNVYFAKGEYEKAAALFDTTLKLIERDYGTDNDNYFKVCNNMILAMKKRGKREKEE